MSHEDHPPQRNTLLDKQLMNISATLVNASRRRDEQIRQRRLGQPAKETMSIANANLERKTARTTEVNGADQKALTAAQNDIESFRREVRATFSATRNQVRVEQLAPSCLSYAAALQLEAAACQWQEVQSWMSYLFSSGKAGHSVQGYKNPPVHDPPRSVGDPEADLSCRVVVTNIAVDAGKAELAKLFHDFAPKIRKIHLLEARDPIKNTQTAYIDMTNRFDAKQASFTMGSIYGLMIKVCLFDEIDG